MFTLNGDAQVACSEASMCRPQLNIDPVPSIFTDSYDLIWISSLEVPSRRTESNAIQAQSKQKDDRPDNVAAQRVHWPSMNRWHSIGPLRLWFYVMEAQDDPLLRSTLR